MRQRLSDVEEEKLNKLYKSTIMKNGRLGRFLSKDCRVQNAFYMSYVLYVISEITFLRMLKALKQ